MRRICLALLLVASTLAFGPGSAGAAPARATAALPRGHAIVVSQYAYACGLATSGTVKCWGSNYARALGPGFPSGSMLPVVVKGVSGAVAISGAGQTPCALLSTHQVRCWGRNIDGLRGDGSTAASNSPTLVTGITTAVDLSVSDHACVVLADGTIECWGSNTKGELGNGEVSPFSNVPVAVKGIADAVAVSTGNQVSCALRADGTVWCWGRDSNNALGTGGPPLGKSLTPVPVKDVTGALEITSGNLSSCARVANGNIKCWGYNRGGQLGNGKANYGRLPEPVKVQKVTKAAAISMGGVGCAVISGGTVKCWGTNYYGVLGTGQVANGSKTADLVVEVSHAVEVAAGFQSACAVLADGTVKCWGMNDQGQLGTGGINRKPRTAVVVKGLSLGKRT